MGLQEGHYENRCEIQGGGSEMATIVGNSDNSSEFVLPSPTFH